MKKIALDTNIFNFCHENGISGKKFSDILTKKKLIPFVSPYVIYELARVFLTDKASKGAKLFSLLQELNPKFITRRDNLYRLEVDKLKCNKAIDFEADNYILSKIIERVKNYSQGMIDDQDCDFILQRQSSLKDTKKIWEPKGAQEVIKDKFDNNFRTLLDNFFNLLLDNDSYRIQYVQKIILVATENEINLSHLEILTLVSNMGDYPALITFIRLYAYWNFLTEKNAAVPSEDRFTDGLVMIEYSYCDIFLSNDDDLINKHGQHINPNIELKKISELIV